MFKGKIADKYLKKEGLTSKDLDDYSWINDSAKPDKIAKAMMAWALDKGASSFCHWFQPMAATMRHGNTGQVQMSMLEYNSDGTPTFELKGKHILFGETDGSSYPNGGMRATHTAGGYLCIDPSSPVFLRDDCMYIPACFVSYAGKALDEKTPLHRAHQALSSQGAGLFKHLGFGVTGMVNSSGLEQELFFIPREAYERRMDLQFTGRTVLGKMPARGQEGCDHYGAHQRARPAMACRRRFRSSATSSASRSRRATARSRRTSTSSRLFRLRDHADGPELGGDADLRGGCREARSRRASAGEALRRRQRIRQAQQLVHLHPCGAQLLNPGDLTKRSGNPELFPIVMSALVAAVDEYGDLMRLAIASPGNDFRLGALEAPPSVISTYLGTQMTAYLKDFMEGNVYEYQPSTSPIDLGVDIMPIVHAPAEDRNRTSPFPYGGHRFEFRAVGSSQNVSTVNTVLNAITAKYFAVIADRIEAGEGAVAIAQDLLKKHSKVIFNGNGYDPEWPKKADELGITHIDSGVEAINKLVDPKNVAMFKEMGVFDEEECAARREIMLEEYVGIIEMEVGCMIDMINQHAIPSAKAAGIDTAAMAAGVTELEAAMKSVHAAADTYESAKLCRTLRLETMIKIRATVDEVEAKCPANLWTYATYKELLFLDSGKFK